MSIISNFRAAEHEDSGSDFEPLTPGWYPVIIASHEKKDTRAGNGQYLALTMEITQGQRKGKKLWANLNLDNPNPKAVEIAERQFADILRAVGVDSIASEDELSKIHFKELEVQVALREYPQGSGTMKEEVKRFRAVKGGSSVVQPSVQATNDADAFSDDGPAWSQG